MIGGLEGRKRGVMGRSIEQLTAIGVEKLARQAGLHSDGGNLFLRVSPTGAASWCFRYMLGSHTNAGLTKNGKRARHEMGLGKYPEITLAKARELAADARRLKAEGKDPIAERNAARQKALLEAAKAITFKQCTETYIAGHRAAWRNAKHARQWKATLATYVLPLIGDLPVQAVDVGLVLRILEPLWTTKPETAARIRGRIETVLDWAKAREYRQGENPARWRGHLDKLLPAHSKVRRVKHHAALPFDQISAFMATLRAENGTAARALEFAILTAARTGEVIGAKWSEISLADKTWTIPAERMKAGKAHRVPLSARAVEILEALRPSDSTAGYVFTSPGTNSALSNMAMLALLKRMGRTDLTTHGFRSTFRDWAAERTNFPNHVVEMALAHALSDKVEAAYRRGELFEKRRALMDQWATTCVLPAIEAKVVPMAKASA